ncbi:MAG: response regulator [bacterium]|nr:response regulator [bacterium]
MKRIKMIIDKPKILVVDDNPVNIEIMVNTLNGLDVEVLSALSGREALELVQKHDIALIFLDIVMPEMDGYETAAKIRKLPKKDPPPITLITAVENQKQHIVKGYEAGAVDYLFRPVDPIILRSKVNVFSQLYKQKQTIKRQQQQLLEEQKMEAIIEMGITVCHEFSQPLSVITGYTEMLLESIEKNSADYKRLSKIADNCEKLNLMLKKVQNITSYEISSYVGDTSMVNLNWRKRKTVGRKSKQ